MHTCQLSWFFQESPSFSLNLPVSDSWLDPQISWEIPSIAFFKFFSLISLFLRFEFELFSIGKRKTDHWNRYTGILLTSVVIGQKWTNQSAQYMIENWHDFRTLISTAFGSLPFGFDRVKRLASRKWRLHLCLTSSHL